MIECLPASGRIDLLVLSAMSYLSFDRQASGRLIKLINLSLSTHIVKLAICTYSATGWFIAYGT